MDYEKKYNDLKQEFDEFVYIISHDFNGPLRAISNLTEWIEEDLVEFDNEDVKSNFKLLKSRVDRLSKMVDASRSISRIERMEMDKSDLDTQKSIEELIGSVINNDQIETSIEGDFPIIHTYSFKFREVITEILNNCIDHNDHQGLQINLLGKVKDQFFELEISDNGKGINPSLKDKVFDLFYTEKSKDEIEGIGAGLFLVKKILRFVDGEISIESEENIFTKVIIKWPLTIQ